MIGTIIHPLPAIVTTSEHIRQFSRGSFCHFLNEYGGHIFRRNGVNGIIKLKVNAALINGNDLPLKSVSTFDR